MLIGEAEEDFVSQDTKPTSHNSSCNEHFYEIDIEEINEKTMRKQSPLINSPSRCLKSSRSQSFCKASDMGLNEYNNN